MIYPLFMNLKTCIKNLPLQRAFLNYVTIDTHHPSNSDNSAPDPLKQKIWVIYERIN